MHKPHTSHQMLKAAISHSHRRTSTIAPHTANGVADTVRETRYESRPTPLSSPHRPSATMGRVTGSAIPIYLGDIHANYFSLGDRLHPDMRGPVPGHELYKD